MLSKTRFLATLLLFLFLLGFDYSYAKPWYKTELEAFINPETFLTHERWRLKPWAVEVPIAAEINHTNQCYQTRLNQFLRTKLSEKDLKVKFKQDYKSNQLYREAQIKFDNQYDLAEFLLLQGWARLRENIEAIPKSYIEAEKTARLQRRGLWGSCDNWFKLRQNLRSKGVVKTRGLVTQSLLKASGVGWIKHVHSPVLLELDSGQMIKLQALKTPSQNTNLHACWSKALLPRLKKRWQGQKVILEGDQLQLDLKEKALHRYVWLPGNRWQSKELLNAWLIKEGVALLDETDLNLKNVAPMKQAQQQFENRKLPPSWWTECLNDTMETDPPDYRKATKKPFDESCPIKGNVSGSKKNPKKTFHTPASGWYERLKPEACFTTESEALEAGFTKVK